MDDKIQKYLVVLRRISKAPDGGKLDTSDDDIHIYEPTLWNWIWRKALGNNGQRDVKKVYRFYEEIKESVVQWTQTGTQETELLERLRQQLKASTVGLKKLKCSYVHDINIVSSYENLIEDIVEPLEARIAGYIDGSRKPGKEGGRKN